MPASALKNVLQFTGLVVDTPSALAHGLNLNGTAVTPQFIIPDAGPYTITVNATNVIVTRTADSPGDAVGVYVEYFHTIEAVFPGNGAAPAGFPFIVNLGSGGGGGGGSGNLIVWTVAKTWAEVYVEIQAADGPKIVLVERDDAGARTMTNNGGAPTDLWDVMFVAFSQQAWDFSGARQVDINVDDEFLLGVEPNSEYAILMSQNINWQFDCTTAPIVTDENVYVQMDGGELSHNNNICFVTSNFRANLYNGASMSGTGGDSLVQESAAPIGGSHVIRAVNTAQLGSLIMDSQDGTTVTVYTDPTVEVNPSAWDGLTTVTYNGSQLLLISPDGTQWIGSVDNAGALAFSS